MKNFTWNCKGKLLYWEQPIVMGILNLTPDSFYDGGKLKDERSILEQAEKMLTEGATLLDIGGMSTRPGADIITEEEELRRIEIPVQKIHQHFPEAFISIDTYRSRVAKTAVECGASVINDVSGGQEDEQIFEVAATMQTPLILMHRRGNSKDMQTKTNYEHILTDLYDFFLRQIKKAKQYQVKDLAIDLGYGFSKTLEQNYFLLQNQSYFTSLNYPILTGISRKGMLYKLLETTSQEALNATTAGNMLALMHDAAILRVHDVRAAVECIRIFSETVKNDTFYSS